MTPRPTNIAAIDADHVTITFATAPAAGAIRVVVLSAPEAAALVAEGGRTPTMITPRLPGKTWPATPADGDVGTTAEVRPLTNPAGNVPAVNVRGNFLTVLLGPGSGDFAPYWDRVNGDFVGTTGDTLEWAARKWFPDWIDDDPDWADFAKADAVTETNWYQYVVGDGGVSYGIQQVKTTTWGGDPSTGAPFQGSVALAADFACAAIRAHYDGALYTAITYAHYPYNIGPGVSETLRKRRALNAWFAGNGSAGGGPDAQDGAYSSYVCPILGGTVNEPGAGDDGVTYTGHLADKPWTVGGF